AVAGGLQVGIDRVAGDQQVQDLGGAFEDAVDAQVTQDLLGGDGAFAGGPQRLGGLVAAAAADLDEFVGHLPGGLAAPQLGQGGLDADVAAALVGHVGGQVEHGLLGERRRCDERDLVRDGR